MPDMVKVTFNGVEYELPSGLTILQAAKQVGIEIPYFCWHEHLSISGNCRMCLVEVKPGPPKPQIACATRIADGMEVVTESENITRTRKAVLEFLLLNHPLDCPVCDEAYECKLQDYTYKYGSSDSRFVDFHNKKRIFERRDLGKLWVEMNRCIDCTRCVRYLKEVAGVYEMDRTHRGHELKINTYKDAFESDFAINAADLCPVGALEDKKFHFKARNWDLVRTPSICPSCSIGCNIDIDVYEGEIQRLLPRENNDVNACWICDYGRHNYDYVNGNRLGSAYRRIDADLVECSYDDALEQAATSLKEISAVHGGEAIGMLLSPQMTNEELFTGKQLAELLGVDRVGVLAGYNHRPIVPVMSDILPKTLVSDDKTPNSTGARLMNLREGEEEFTFAHELLTAIEDGKIKGLILFHEDLAAMEGFDTVQVKKAMALLDFLLVVSVKPTGIGQQAHVVLPTLTYAEKAGTFTNHQKRVQRLYKAVTPLAGVLGELPILTRLGRKFNETFGYDKVRDAFAVLCEKETAFAGLQWQQIGEQGVLIDEAKTESD